MNIFSKIASSYYIVSNYGLGVYFLSVTLAINAVWHWFSHEVIITAYHTIISVEAHCVLLIFSVIMTILYTVIYQLIVTATITFSK